MAKAKPAKAKSTKPKADPEALKQLSAQVLERVEAQQTVDTLPAGAQAGLFNDGTFKKVLARVVKGVVANGLELLTIGADGTITPAEGARLVEMSVKFVMDLLAKDATPAA